MHQLLYRAIHCFLLATSNGDLGMKFVALYFESTYSFHLAR